MCGTMNTTVKRMFILILIVIFIFILYFITKKTTRPQRFIPMPRPATNICPSRISKQTITPLSNTKHLLVSAYMDQRLNGFDIRIIGIFEKDSTPSLHCLFCCAGKLSETTPATIRPHPQNFGFPFIPTDVICKIPQNCDATHVSLLREEIKVYEKTWLPIRNQKMKGNEEKKFHFTVCISVLFGGYNNVLQFAQTLEMYKLLGVDRVVIYNTSCGRELDRLLQSYSREGFVEMVPWPIDKYLKPSHGWLYSEHGGDIHYYGQLITLNECIYRSMDRSRYVLLNDIDEIIMPYQHDNLESLMQVLQQQHPNAAVYQIENHIFPKKHFEPNRTWHLPQWNKVPGINILEHIYREVPDRNIYHPYKLIVQPRMVEQTSVHEVIKIFGQQYKVPPDVCRIIHVRTALQGSLKLEKLNVDKRLWDFTDKLIPSVDKALRKVDLLSRGGKS